MSAHNLETRKFSFERCSSLSKRRIFLMSVFCEVFCRTRSRFLHLFQIQFFGTLSGICKNQHMISRAHFNKACRNGDRRFCSTLPQG